MGVETYSTDAGANTALFPEGQAPSTLNNGDRQFQADMATWYNDPGWYRPGAPAPTLVYLTSTTFRHPGVDVTGLYFIQRRIRVTSASINAAGVCLGTITASAYSGGNTNVTVELDDGLSLVNEPFTVDLGVQSGPNSPNPLASTLQRGIIELATAAEIVTGTDLLRAMTPGYFTDGWALISGTYWRVNFALPGGLKFEIGVAQEGVTRTYTTAFTTKVAVLVTPSHGTTTGTYRSTVKSETLAGFVPVSLDSSGNEVGIAVSYLAVGY